MRQSGDRTVRKNDGGIAITKRGFDRENKSGGIEKLADIGLGEASFGHACGMILQNKICDWHRSNAS